MTKISPFKAAIPQTAIDDLHVRLDNARWPELIETKSWEAGVPTHYLKNLADYWRNDFDWRAQEERLNKYPQFTTEIDGQTIHFLHVESPEPDAMPLIITHGWPGSVFEFLNIIEPLTNPRAHGGDPKDAFHVVIPSIPGFGFSGPTKEAGWNLARIAGAWAELMDRLGYDKYFAQGGDAGTGISTELSHAAGGKLLGIHMNGPAIFPQSPEDKENLSKEDQVRLERLEKFQSEGMAYYQLQATRPQTLAYALNDSPIGQLAWIVEKFQEWTDPAKKLPEDAVNIDELLANVSLYWFTGTSGSAARLLYETTHAGGWPMPPAVPVGIAVFAGDNTIRAMVQKDGNKGHFSEFDRGGHFAAMEAPDLLVGDVREFFRTMR
jgi:epoxide hydrolase